MSVRAPHRWSWAATLVAACSFHPQGSSIDRQLDAPIDSPPDAGVDAGSCVPWNALNVTPCDSALGVPAPVVIGSGSYTFDTGTAQLAGTSSSVLPGAIANQLSPGPPVRVVNATTLDIAAGATITVSGLYPLVFVVHGDATIDGTVDVSAQLNGLGASVPGPGGDDATQCGNGIGADGAASTGVGGGGGAGGGGYGDTGGDGGDGQGAGHGAHGGHGNATGMPMITPLRGGCRGGAGGAASTAAATARAGNGGGAIEVTASGTIAITGTLVASGTGGGTLSLVNGGGGGGGAGGAIVLDGDSAQVMSTASLCANGGGGGEGDQTAGSSAAGSAGTCSATLVASGGSNDPDGGDGGSGGGLPATKGTNGAAGANGAGGGGGGGGVGRIRVRGRTTRTIDPSAIVTPGAAP